MKTYLFETTMAMKPHNQDRWWIDNYIPIMHLKAKTIDEALQQYKNNVEDKHCVAISKNAIKTKEPMYRDEGEQIGYVITGKTMFQKEDGSWVDEYINLWVDILETRVPDFVA